MQQHRWRKTPRVGAYRNHDERNSGECSPTFAFAGGDRWPELLPIKASDRELCPGDESLVDESESTAIMRRSTDTDGCRCDRCQRKRQKKGKEKWKKQWGSTHWSKDGKDVDDNTSEDKGKGT